MSQVGDRDMGTAQRIMVMVRVRVRVGIGWDDGFQGRPLSWGPARTEMTSVSVSMSRKKASTAEAAPEKSVPKLGTCVRELILPSAGGSRPSLRADRVGDDRVGVDQGKGGQEFWAQCGANG